jgi:predicted transposase/invertase (TIGR01784 family)
MSDQQQLHDAFCRDFFSHPEVYRSLFTNHLPPEISELLDLSDVEMVKSSYFDSTLQSSHLDLLYRVKLKSGGYGYIFILLEHKSYQDKMVAFQILCYKNRIWEQELKDGAKKLSPIFPIVLYHGLQKWTVKKNFNALIDFGENVHLKKYEPDFEYYLFDVTKYNEEGADDDPALIIGLAAMKYIFRSEAGEKLRDYLKHLKQMPKGKALAFADTLMHYIFGAAATRVTIEDAKEGLQKGFSEKGGGKKMESILEQLRREGMEKGLIQGRSEGFAELTLCLLQKKFGKIGKRTQSQIRKLSTEKLESLGEALLDMQKRSELTAWLSQNDSSTIH